MSSRPVAEKDGAGVAALGGGKKDRGNWLHLLELDVSALRRCLGEVGGYAGVVEKEVEMALLSLERRDEGRIYAVARGRTMTV